MSEKGRAEELRRSASQPLEWPEGTDAPFSRLALTALILRVCEEQDLATSGWDVPLLKPERIEHDNDYTFGDPIGVVVERVLCDHLGATSAWQPEASYTLGNLIVELEEAFLELWRPLARVRNPEAGALAAVEQALGHPVALTTRLAEAVPPRQLSAFWAQLDSPWFELMPGVPTGRVYWPLSPKAAGFLVLGLAICAGLLLWTTEPLRFRLFFVFITLLLCGSAAWQRLDGQVRWPKELVTVGDLVALLAANYRAQRERLSSVGAEGEVPLACEGG